MHCFEGFDSFLCCFCFDFVALRFLSDELFICIKSESLMRIFKHFFWSSIAISDDLDDPGFEVKIRE